MNVLISGASVAGPALAYWLARHGFRPTVVEIAPDLRGGGYAVDFRSDAHLTVLSRMGVLDELRAVATGGSPGSYVDASGAEIFALPAEFTGGDIEVRRSDLARVLHGRTRAVCEYLFGDSITSLTETPTGVDVTFARSAPRTFDLVVGADGLHSNVRRLAFGPEEEYLSHLGYYVAGWPAPEGTVADRVARTYNEPGRMISVGTTAGRPEVFAAFTSGVLAFDRRDLAAQKEIIARTYAGMGWRAAELVGALAGTGELYFDAISRIDVPVWSRGRIALAGDAAHGATLGGMGTGTAVVGAYILAGELAAAGGDHAVAFAAYEKELRDFATTCQEGGETTGSFLSPATAEKLAERDAMMLSPEFPAMMSEVARERAADIELKGYGLY
ncbi:FAD-dependent monooxygenase [Phytomonospora endophytica]|uniref:2-polyprenyl-6-methoxyphenol hydroxylase-like FAD-dependent oxidoreductase n=1 Tax=Phytomonospora endophytica TaxID=714109 RepID=A0A841FMK8_9ACTN|nr:FAD-dependent monooxygenase [Phytomonospora endophytica]MBB6034447.1 2-polyprenyl-6-methoxyphenol hydroxylase-like FAD-dependent oxidoreductase [Phytomonospora endophytica]GIG66841.1 FAD-dependent oxidoreductase [Phytomonospora endophytica]